MAMSGMMFIEMLLTMAMTGGDLLDYVKTETYWKLKGVTPTAALMMKELSPQAATTAPDVSDLIKQLGDNEFDTRQKATEKLAAMGDSIRPQIQKATESSDAEVSSRAKRILADMKSAPRVQAIRTLMAIRTLGEMKEAKAAEPLKKLLDSKDPFVAEYAKRAIANIEGKPWRRPLPSDEDMKKDLAAIPATSSAIAQARMVFDAPPLENIMKEMLKASNGPAEGKMPDAAEMLAKSILQAVETCGNVRLDALTVGVAGDVGNDSGYVVMLGRGQFDPAALKLVAPDNKMSDAPAAAAGTEVIWLNSHFCLAFTGSDRAAMVVGPGVKNLPIAEVTKGLVSGKGGITDNADMAKLLAKVDTTKPIWAAAVMTESYRKAPFLGGLDTFVIAGDYKDSTLSVKLTATGAKAEDVQTSRQNFEEILGQAKKEIAREAARMEFLKVFSEALEAIELKQDGATITGTATLKQPERLLALPAMFIATRSVVMEEAMKREMQIRNAQPVPAPAN